MTTSLFRQEAIDAHRAKIWGEVTLSLPLSLTAITTFLVLCVVGVAVFLATGSYARKEHAPGFLATRLGVATIMAGKPGVVTILHVREGQVVEAGAPLLTVSVEQTSESGDGNDSAMLARLREKGANLDQQLELESRRAQAENDRLQKEIAGVGAEIAGMNQELKVQAKRTALARDQVDTITDLARRGVISQFELKKREDTYLTLQQAELNFRLSIGDKQRALDAKRGELARLPIATAGEMSRLRAAIGDVEMKLRQIEGDRAYLITAPKAGRVSAMQAWVGKTVDAVTPQMSIVPEGDTLVAELFVPARAIGFIAPGQPVHINYASFPYQHFGFAEGTVETVSHTLLKPDQSVGPMTFGAPAYRVTIALKRQTIPAYGKDVALQADMQLDADIVLDRRGLLAWLFDPLLASWRRPA